MKNNREPHAANRGPESRPIPANPDRDGPDRENLDREGPALGNPGRSRQQGEEGPGQVGGQLGGQWGGEPIDAVDNQSVLGWQAVCWIVALLGVLGGLVYLLYWPIPFGWTWSLFPASNQAEIIRHLPGILGALSLLMLLGLIWSIHHGAQRSSYYHFRRARQTSYAIGGLLEELQALTGESGEAADGGDNPIAQWQAGNTAQVEGISRVTQEISGMADTFGRIGESASKSTELASYSAETAKKGAAVVRDAITGLSATRSQIQDAAGQLKQCGESLQRIEAIVNLIRDATEQTSVLSINTALQAAVVGEAGREFADAAEEVQRLSGHSARGTGKIAELTQIIESGTDSVSASMQATAGEVAAGVTLADEAGRALTEIQNAGRDLLKMIEQSVAVAAGEATHAQAVGEKLGQLKTAAEQSGENVTRIIDGLKKSKAIAIRLSESTPVSRLP